MYNSRIDALLEGEKFMCIDYWITSISWPNRKEKHQPQGTFPGNPIFFLTWSSMLIIMIRKLNWLTIYTWWFYPALTQ